MSTRCIQPKHLISLSAILAIAIWPSVSRASYQTVDVVTWNSTTHGLNLGTTGSLNLTNNALIIQADNETDAIAAYNYAYQEVASGVNGNPGSYEAGTPGIVSDATAYSSDESAFTDPDGLTGIGVVLNDGATANPLSPNDPSWSTWNGVSVNSYSVLIAFTYLGDADMSGIAQSYDVATVLNSLDFPSSSTNSGWANGEFDYSGSVQPYDVATALNGVTFDSTDPIVGSTNPGVVVGGPVGVPEPGTLALAGFGLVGMLLAAGIRRRHLSAVAA